jgi:hypothetical protein
MLKDLRRYSNLGTPNYFYFLFDALLKNKEAHWTKENAQHFFYNKIIDGNRIFDGCLELALLSNIIRLENGELFLNEEISQFANEKEALQEKIIEYVFLALCTDEDFLSIFNQENLSYDVIYKNFLISNSAFKFKFSNFKQFLLDFNVISVHPIPEIKKCVLNKQYKTFFDKSILPLMRKRRISVAELKKSQEKKEEYGIEAEKFVLDFEEKRLSRRSDINWVAEYVVNEGYDIASFNDISDNNHNRFIEVKSYRGNSPYFYWSKNEYQTARLRKEHYWLYLVNRDKINDDGYVPLMKQNPYETILNNKDWNVEIESYKIKMITS